MKLKNLLFIVIGFSILVTWIYHTTQRADIYYYQGFRAFEQKRYGAALPFYKKVLSIDPHHIQALKDLGYVYLALNDEDQAVAIFEEAVSLDESDLRLKRALADLYLKREETAKAISFYEDVSDAVDTVRTKETLARLYLDEGSPEKAEKILGGLLQESPEEVKMNLFISKLKDRFGRAEETPKIYQEITQNKIASLGGSAHGERKARELLAETFMAGGKTQEAAIEFRKVLENDPKNADARMKLARILSWDKDLEASIAEYETALADAPDRRDIAVELARVYSWGKEHEKAEFLFKSVLEKEPENPDALSGLALILSWQRRYDEALQFFEKVSRLGVESAVDLEHAKALLYSGDRAAAIDFLEALLFKEPEDMEAKILLADAYAYSKNYARAISLYRRLLSQTGDFRIVQKLADVLSWDKQYKESLALYDQLVSESDEVELKLQKARILGWAGKYRASLKEYRKILVENPGAGNEVDLEMRAKQAIWSNRVLDAIDILRGLIDRVPENVTALFDLSQVYAYQEMWPEATRLLERVLSLEPDHAMARVGLEKIRSLSQGFGWHAGFSSVEEDSSKRTTDVKKNIWSYQGVAREGERLRWDFSFGLTERFFGDRSKALEHREATGIYRRFAPLVWAGAFYSFESGAKDIRRFHGFGGSVGLPFLRIGSLRLSHQRKRLEENSTVLRRGLFEEEWSGEVLLDVTQKFKASFDYVQSHYSDNNRRHEPGLNLRYDLGLDPERFSLRYRFFFRDCKEVAADYFSPDRFWTQRLTLDWSYFFSKEGLYFGAQGTSLDFSYSVSLDSEDIVSHGFSAGWTWDISDCLSANVHTDFSLAMEDVYRSKSFSATLKYRF